MPDLARIVKAYDIRGVVPDELDESLARDIGAAFVRVVEASTIVTAYDMRDSSPGLARAFAEGATSQGADVVEAGLGSTDLLYYAAGALDVPGAMFTASHNPAKYNGIKLCRAGASPVGQDTGLADIRALVESGIPSYDGPSGSVTRRELLADYAAYMKQLVPGIEGIRRLSAVVDAGNGMGGLTVPVVFDGLPIDLTPMYFELDGSFPNHEANPIEPDNLRDLQAKVRETGADIGLAFDGDADRCFVVDETGGIVSPSVLTALIAVRELDKEPGSTVIHNLITLPRGAGDRARARRPAGADASGALVHQGDDGRDGCGFRWRALRSLLLPRLLAGRLRHARRAARARRARHERQAVVGVARGLLPLRRLR